MSTDDLFGDYPKIDNGYIIYSSRMNYEDYPEDLSSDKQKKLAFLRRRTFTKQDVEDIRKKILEGESLIAIAAIFKTTVSKIAYLEKRKYKPLRNIKDDL